jgi:hypothetical protein
LGDINKISAVGISMATLNVFMLSIGFAISKSVDFMTSEAYKQGNFQ